MLSFHDILSIINSSAKCTCLGVFEKCTCVKEIIKHTAIIDKVIKNWVEPNLPTILSTKFWFSFSSYEFSEYI